MGQSYKYKWETLSWHLDFRLEWFCVYINTEKWDIDLCETRVYSGNLHILLADQ